MLPVTIIKTIIKKKKTQDTAVECSKGAANINQRNDKMCEIDVFVKIPSVLLCSN